MELLCLGPTEEGFPLCFVPPARAIGRYAGAPECFRSIGWDWGFTVETTCGPCGSFSSLASSHVLVTASQGQHDRHIQSARWTDSHARATVVSSTARGLDNGGRGFTVAACLPLLFL